MAEVVVPPQASPGLRSTLAEDRCDLDGNGSPYSLNQAFSFPPQQPSSTPSGGAQPVLSSAAVMAHRNRPSKLSFANLPAFEFDSAGSPGLLMPSPSPTRSPVRLTPPTHLGHKRAGSEFVGGEISSGGPVLVPTTTADDTRPPSAPSSPVRGPPSSWRGHAHRRSHAVSQSDVKSIMQPAAQASSGSLPVTPLDDPTRRLISAPQRSSSHDPMPLHSHSRSIISSTSAPTARHHVEFSDTPEIIRPLSTISSETSSSMSTVRMSHSLSESVSSLHAGAACNPAPIRNMSLPSDARITASQCTSSPSTDALASECTPHSSIPSSITEPEPQDSKFEAPAWAAMGDGTTMDLINPFDVESAGQSTSASKPAVPGNGPEECPSPHTNLAQASPVVRPKTSPNPSSSHNASGVMSWADTFLHGKDKRRRGSARQTMTSDQSPELMKVQEPQFSLEDISFDDDTTTIIEDQSVAAPVRKTFTPASRGADLSSEVSVSSNSMIDLDLAMSSPGFSADSSSDFAGKTNMGIRKLHSSRDGGGFTGPGGHYVRLNDHRRTESAPDLETFERRLGFPRFGSNPAMEEAIVEEDEEPDAEAALDDSHALGLGVNIVDEDLDCDNRQRDDTVRPRNEARRVIRRISTPPDTLAVQPVKIADLEEEPRFSVMTKSSDDSSITPTVSPDPFVRRPVSAPLDFAVQTPSLVYESTPEIHSNVSSADYRTPSFGSRVHTARSSLTDRMTLSSSKAGNMSAASSEDVPSLTSSASTVMSGLPSRMSTSHRGNESGARAASFSGPTTLRGRPGSSSKRASLASLSKLMGGPYSKSKLNIAETLRPDSPSPEKVHRKKHRISRMMKFWKSKESLSNG